MVRFFFALAVVSIFFLPSAFAAKTKDQIQKEKVLRSLVTTLSSFANYKELIESLPRKADREYLLHELGDNAELPVKVRYVEPDSVFFESGEVRVTVAVRDFASRKFMILKKEFTFDPQESAEVSIGRMRRALVAANPLRSLVLPDAAANPILMVAGRLITQYVIPGYITAFAGFTLWCAQGYNTLGACAGMGLEWPLAAKAAGQGLVNLMIDKVKFHFSTAAFDLQELKCQGGAGLTAFIQDEQKQTLELDVRFTTAGGPFNFTLKSPKGAEETFYFKRDWSPDPTRMQGYEQKIDQKSFALMAKAIQTLRFACFNHDNGDAMEEYFHRNRKVPKVEPNIDKNGVSAKTAE